MNLLAAMTSNKEAVNQVFNTAVNAKTDLNQLFEMLRVRLEKDFAHLKNYKPVYRDFRAGDVKHSQADVSKARDLLGYIPSHTVEHGLDQALEWYKKALS
jgi:UDP-N-acetylglucosamine 4-epimerase